MTNFEMVAEFRNKFGFPTLDSHDLMIIDDAAFLFRYNLIIEEAHELLVAHRKADIVAVADAIADLLYVTYGIAHEYGLPIDEVFVEVHRANMQKERSTGANDPRGKRGSGADVIKPEGFKPPDIYRVLGLR